MLGEGLLVSVAEGVDGEEVHHRAVTNEEGTDH